MTHKEGWQWHGQRFEGESFLENQWRGDPLNGQTLTVWNDVGMGDAFQFVRYTLPLLQRGESVRFAVAESQIPLFRDYLAWHLPRSLIEGAFLLRKEDRTFP